MKKPISCAIALGMVLSLSVTGAGAHETGGSHDHDYSICPSFVADINSPAANATVGRTFALSGKVRQTSGSLTPDFANSHVYFNIDNVYYVDPRNRNFNPDNPNAQYYTFSLDAQGNFSATIDLNGNAVLEQYASGPGGDSVRRGVPDGRHVLSVIVYPNVPYSEESAHCFYGPGLFETQGDLVFNLQSAAATSRAQNESRVVQKPKPTETPTALPTPSGNPIQEDPAVAGSFWDRLDPQWWALIGLLLGGLLLAGVEAISRKYHKRGRK